MNKNILKLLVAALTFSSCSQLDQPQSDAAGALHITSVSIDGQERIHTRATYGETVTHDYAYNRSITGFQPGDQLMLDYSFGAETSYAYATYNGSTWKITSDKSGGTPIDIKPGAGEKWANLSMDVLYGGGVLEESDANAESVTSAMGITKGDVDSYFINEDCLMASNGYIGTVTIDTDLNSQTLGAVTINLKHWGALLRLPMTQDELKVKQGTYIVDGVAHNVTGLATLWVKVKQSDYWSDYSPFTKVKIDGDDYLQTIVPANPSGMDQYNLDGFRAVLNTDNGSNVTIDLPFKVDGNASQGMSLVVNTCYPLTLNISPNNAEVSLASEKPGWGSKENELNNDRNELIPAAITQLKYINSYDSRSYFEVSGPQGLILMNKWMAGLVTNEFMHGLNIEGAQNVFINQYYEPVKPMSAIIKLAADITLPEDYVWSPIGTDNNPYTGWFDGANFTITNLTVNNTSDGYVGFVGAMTGMVSNLKLENVSINGKYAGGVAGKVSGFSSSLVSNCIVEGKVTGTICVGGIVGTSNEGRVNGCINNADVELKNPTASYYCSAGGVIGSMSKGAHCMCCANTGVISINVPDFNIGGVAGVVSVGSSNVIGCWTINTYKNKETSTSLTPIGYKESYPIIQACYAVSNDTSGKEELAGKIGYVDDSTSGATMSMNNALKNGTYYWLHSQTGDWPTITTTKPTMPNPS